MNIKKLLEEIEIEFQNNPDKIWEYLNEDDLLITSNKRNKYIICVKEFLPDKRTIFIKFIYSLTTDKFYEEDGTESPDMVERSPTKDELDQLRNNLDYLKYKSR